jgi:hypothetical protein
MNHIDVIVLRFCNDDGICRFKLGSLKYGLPVSSNPLACIMVMMMMMMMIYPGGKCHHVPAVLVVSNTG